MAVDPANGTILRLTVQAELKPTDPISTGGPRWLNMVRLRLADEPILPREKRLNFGGLENQVGGHFWCLLLR